MSPIISKTLIELQEEHNQILNLLYGWTWSVKELIFTNKNMIGDRVNAVKIKKLNKFGMDTEFVLG